MFILFYLDTRKALMKAFHHSRSYSYNQTGYNIYVHYPRYDSDLKMWGAYSMFFSEHDRNDIPIGCQLPDVDPCARDYAKDAEP